MSREEAVQKWEKAGWAFLLIFAASDFFSISIAQIAAAGMGVCWAGRHVAEGRRPDMSPLFRPVVVFIIVSLIAAFHSLDVIESIKDSKDLLHFFILFSAYDLLRRSFWKTGVVFRVIAAAGGLVAVVGLVKALRRGVDIYNRISGFQDIYMTFAGLLMLAIVLGAAFALFDFRKWRDGWALAAIAFMAAAVLLSLTRNAWIGVFAGVAALAFLRKPIALVALPLVAIAALVLSPPEIHNRIASVTDPNNESNRERLLVWGAGLRIIADYPVFGVGQNSFPLVYPKYRAKNVKEPHISHLHNNFLELAAERGLVGLAAWIWLWGAALWVTAKAWRSAEDDKEVKTALAACMGGVVAFLAAGLFEYNFGDSEIQMMFYFILAAGMAGVSNAGAFGQRKATSDLS